MVASNVVGVYFLDTFSGGETIHGTNVAKLFWMSCCLCWLTLLLSRGYNVPMLVVVMVFIPQKPFNTAVNLSASTMFAREIPFIHCDLDMPLGVGIPYNFFD